MPTTERRLQAGEPGVAFGGRVRARGPSRSFSERSNGSTCGYPPLSIARSPLNCMLTAEAGLEDKVDVVGYVVGRNCSSAADRETVIVGSHHHTVTNVGTTMSGCAFCPCLSLSSIFRRQAARCHFISRHNVFRGKRRCASRHPTFAAQRLWDASIEGSRAPRRQIYLCAYSARRTL